MPRTTFYLHPPCNSHPQLLSYSWSSGDCSLRAFKDPVCDIAGDGYQYPAYINLSPLATDTNTDGTILFSSDGVSVGECGRRAVHNGCAIGGGFTTYGYTGENKAYVVENSPGNVADLPAIAYSSGAPPPCPNVCKKGGKMCFLDESQDVSSCTIQNGWIYVQFPPEGLECNADRECVEMAEGSSSFHGNGDNGFTTSSGAEGEMALSLSVLISALALLLWSA